MLAAIGDATSCPHGHPIVEGAREQGVLLADVEPGPPARAPLPEALVLSSDRYGR